MKTETLYTPQEIMVALVKLERRLATAWIADQNERTSDKKMKAAWAAVDEARNELTLLLERAFASRHVSAANGCPCPCHCD